MADSSMISVAFNNLENIFDTVDDPHILDDDFTAEGTLQWTKERYENKLYKLSRAISQIGMETIDRPPSIVGVAEVENKKVLADLVSYNGLKELNYSFVHHNSPDERGIDTGLLYRKEDFEPLESATVTVMVYNPEDERDFTRDILYVRGNLFGEMVHIYVNHWPSRRDGDQKTDYKRITAAKTLIKHLKGVKEAYPHGKFIIMGDFNDNPNSESVKDHLIVDGLFNPMTPMLIPTKQGSVTYKGRWNLFDQIIISTNFFATQEEGLKFDRAEILSERFLEDWNERFEGFPFRTYAGRKYIGGYSDHFPVYIVLKNSRSKTSGKKTVI